MFAIPVFLGCGEPAGSKPEGDSGEAISGDADYRFSGEESRDYAGGSVASPGDVDGDGLDDILIGADGEDSGGGDAGAAYLILASGLGSDSDIDLALSDYKFIGETGGDSAGHSVASAGDVDGDGLADLLIGANNHSEVGTDAGAAYLLLTD